MTHLTDISDLRFMFRSTATPASVGSFCGADRGELFLSCSLRNEFRSSWTRNKFRATRTGIERNPQLFSVLFVFFCMAHRSHSGRRRVQNPLSDCRLLSSFVIPSFVIKKKPPPRFCSGTGAWIDYFIWEPPGTGTCWYRPHPDRTAPGFRRHRWSWRPYSRRRRC